MSPRLTWLIVNSNATSREIQILEAGMGPTEQRDYAYEGFGKVELGRKPLIPMFPPEEEHIRYP